MSILDSQEWQDAVVKLRKKASEFNSIFYDVESSNVSGNSELQSEKDSLLWKGRAIKNTIENITSGIDAVYRAAQGSGLSGAVNLGNVGFLPLIPIAVILSAIGAITYWVNDAIKYLNKVQRVEDYKQAGYSTVEANEMVFGSEFSFRKNLPWILGSVAVLILVPPVLKRIRS